MDIAVKTSLASYEFRAEGPKKSSGSNARLNASRDADEAMLALVDRQLLISGQKLRAGESRKAAELLRKTYTLAINHSTASPQGDKPLVVRLATALVRIQLCTALSQLDRHPQALEEATLAKHELDIVWHLMTGATVEMAVADSLGDTSRPDAVLRRHVVNPPGWLERAIEASIHARLCMAIEMESILPDDQFQAALDSAEAMDAGLPPPKLQASSTIQGNSKPKQARPVSRGAMGSEADESTRPSTRTSARPVSRGALAASKLGQPDEDEDLDVEDLPVVGMPVPAFTTGQELQGLYREALRLGAKLLPSGHEARGHAERVEKQARARWKQILELANPVTAQALSSRPNTEVLEDTEADEANASQAALTADAQLPFLSRSSKLRRSTRPDSARRSDYGSSIGSTEAGSKDFLGVPSALLHSTDSFGSVTSHAEWSKNAPPGDVFYRSLASSYAASCGGSVHSDAASRKNKRKKKKRGSSPDGSPINAPVVAEPRERDPFKDWQKNYMDVGKMSLFQQKLMSLQGINSLQLELRDQSRQFSHYMKDLGALPDGNHRLGEDRILYSDHGVKAMQAGQLKSAAVRKKAWHPSQKGHEAQQLEGELFKYYGIPVPQDGVDVKALKTLIKESFERSPEEKRRREQEEAARKSREFEEERRKRASLAAAFGFHKPEAEKPPPTKGGKRGSVMRASFSAPSGLNLKG